MVPEADLPGDLRGSLEARGFRVRACFPLPGDVSPRRYARLVLAGGAETILARYPAEIRDVGRRFLATTRLLDAAGVRVPAVLGHDLDAGWMLVEDLGASTLFELDWSWPERLPYFDHAVRQIARLQAIPETAVEALNPPLDRALLGRELEQTWELFLMPEGLAGEGEERAALRRSLETLCERLASDRPVVCHRDLMARNLVPLPPRGAGGRVGVLDHQDLRLGPPFYDLASLLNDSLFAPPEIEARLLAERVATPAARRAYHRAAAQRTLKAIGTFAACARRGSPHRAALIPATLARSLEHLRVLPETSPRVTALARRARPILARSPLPIC